MGAELSALTRGQLASVSPCRPAVMADLSRDTCRYCDRNVVAPNSANPTAREAITASAAVRSRRMGSGMIGCVTFASTRTNASRLSAPTPVSAAVGTDSQP